MDDRIDERHEAKLIEHELIERHDLVIGIICNQVVMAHNRAIKARTISDQRSEAQLIARLTELYLTLI